jgi:hypothetical protein
MDPASLDTISLLLAHTALSGLASLSTAPVWSVPVALYGLVAVQKGLDGSNGAEAGRTVRFRLSRGGGVLTERLPRAVRDSVRGVDDLGLHVRTPLRFPRNR